MEGEERKLKITYKIENTVHKPIIIIIIKRSQTFAQSSAMHSVSYSECQISMQTIFGRAFIIYRLFFENIKRSIQIYWLPYRKKVVCFKETEKKKLKVVLQEKFTAFDSICKPVNVMKYYYIKCILCTILQQTKMRTQVN